MSWGGLLLGMAFYAVALLSLGIYLQEEASIRWSALVVWCIISGVFWNREVFK